MDVVRRDTASDDLDLLRGASLADEVSGSRGNVTNKYGIAILGDPDDMVGTIKGGVARLAIVLIHDSSLSC